MLNLDINKEITGRHIVYGRVGDNNSHIEKVSVINSDGTPFSLTGISICFMGNTHQNQTKVIDSDGVKIVDAAKGLFQYTFPSMAFGVAGPYERAYFQFTNKDGVITSTGDFEVIVLDNTDITSNEAETVITEYNKLVAELNEQQNQAIDEMNRNFTEAQGRISELEVQINDLRNKIDQALTDFENGNFWTKEESLNKEESSANVIYQVIGKEKAEITFRLDAKSEFVKVSSVGYTTLLSPTNVSWTPLTEEQLNNLSSLDGSLYSARDVAANYMKQLKYDCDILGFFKSLLGEKFFTIRGATTDSQKVEVLESLITDFTSNVYGYGSGGGINKLTHRNWNGTWTVSDSTAANEVTRIGQTIESTDTNWKKLINGGKISVLSNSEPTISPNYSTVNIDYLCLDVTIELSANEHFEYMIAANHVENLATQAEAELGEDNTKTMTPLRTDQYFKAHLATQEEAENGVSHLKTMTPKRTAEQTLARFGQSFTPSTKFIAHRGNNYFYPENSIAAFEKTSRHWGAETDIQLTTDGKWYCFHDRTLDRMTNGTGNFMDKTSSEIEALRLDTGNGINTLSDVEKKIPTFEQYLNACIKARIVPVIEITPLKTDFTDAQLDSIVTVIRRKGLLNKCVIICFTYEVLVKMRQRMPYTVMHWLISEYSEEMIQKCVINNFVPSFDYSKASVNQALIDKIHDAGLECGLWTVPYSDHQKYTDMGVDNITTDSASGNLRYFEPALRSGMTANKTDLTGPTYIEETSNGEIHIRVNVTGGQNDVGVYICALEKWAIPRHSLTLIGYVRSTKVTGFSFVPVAVGVGGYSAQDASTADPNIKFGYLCTGTNWEQRSSYAAFDLFYRI